MGAAIDPERILRELAELWVSLGRESSDSGSTGVLRACSMTLLVLAEESDDPAPIGETLAALMPEHPSRVILIRVRPSAVRDLSSRVFSECWMPFGQRRHICCEQIEITASDASLPDLPPVLLSLAAPDLPAILWCRSPRLFELPVFPQLAEAAQKLILDSAAFQEPPAILRKLQDCVQDVADLSWTRLTPWRQLISQVFENQSYLQRLPAVDEVCISRPDNELTMAWYLGAWLAAGLAAIGSSPRVRFEPAGALEVLLAGPGLRVSIGRGELRIDGMECQTAFPKPTDYLLLREELAIPGRDPVFEKALAGAVRLALSS